MAVNMLLCALSLVLILIHLSSCSPIKSSRESEIVIPMPAPGPHGVKHNEYRCAAVSVPLKNGYIIKYEPQADPRVAHHMLLYGCAVPAVRKGSWDCKGGMGICALGGTPEVVFAWALNASGLNLPPDVGFQIGSSVGISYLVIQIHYGYPEDIPDLSSTSQQALTVHTTTRRQRYITGIFLLGSGGSVEPGKKEAIVDSACLYTGPKAIYPFAFRTHAHSLGKQIVGYVVKPNMNWEVIGTRSPQDAQAFYEAEEGISVNPADWLAVRCVFNTENKQYRVHMGPDSEDEMCNFYIMYYTLNDNRDLLDDSCWSRPPLHMKFPSELPPLPAVTTPTHDDDDDDDHDGHTHLHEGHAHLHEANSVDEDEKDDSKQVATAHASTPSTASPTLPPPPSTTAAQHVLVSEPRPQEPELPPESPGLVESEDWALNGFPIPQSTLGQVSAVAVDGAGDLHVLHRGPVVFDSNSFNFKNVYQHIKDGPIVVPTLLRFSAKTGQPEEAWASSIFYLPHGLTIDHKGSFWVTDVALHQVMKFEARGDTEPSLVLGKAFQPGQAYTKFCKPTSVAVEQSGMFYVADGYCNSRVLKFNEKGELAEVWEAPVDGKHLFIPHKIVLDSTEEVLYLADRENQRVISYNIPNGGRAVVVARDLGGGRPYGISFNGSDWPLYGVFGVFESGSPGLGFSLDKSGHVINTWGPEEGFVNPHDITVDPVHHAVYITEIGPNRIWKFVPFPSPTQDVSDISDELENMLDKSVENSSTLLTGGHKVTDNNTTEEEEGSGSSMDDAESEENSAQTKKPTTGVNVGVIIVVVTVASLVLLVCVGIMKEHRLIKFRSWRLLGERDATIGVNPVSGHTKHRETEEKERKKKRKKKKKMTPKKKLQSLLGPSQLGFSRLRTYDSNSEDEEFPVFNRV